MGMSDQKILQVLDLYETEITKALIVGYHRSGRVSGRLAEFTHLHDMIPKMRAFLAEGRREKVFRWLGFMQGALWVLDVYTIEEMADHNRPPESEFDHERVGE